MALKCQEVLAALIWLSLPIPDEMQPPQPFCSLAFLQISMTEEPNETETIQADKMLNPGKTAYKLVDLLTWPVLDQMKLIFFLSQFRW